VTRDTYHLSWDIAIELEPGSRRATSITCEILALLYLQDYWITFYSTYISGVVQHVVRRVQLSRCLRGGNQLVVMSAGGGTMQVATWT
jgi:hypothetical protein